MKKQAKKQSNWIKISEMPKNGDWCFCTDGNGNYAVLNAPENCHIGKWHYNKKYGWDGCGGSIFEKSMKKFIPLSCILEKIQ